MHVICMQIWIILNSSIDIQLSSSADVNVIQASAKGDELSISQVAKKQLLASQG